MLRGDLHEVRGQQDAAAGQQLAATLDPGGVDE
jgi:hypothetical protein